MTAREEVQSGDIAQKALVPREYKSADVHRTGAG